MTKRFLSLLLFSVPAIQALDTARWQVQSPIQIPPGFAGIAAVKLTREIYVRSRADLADLRVVSGGEEVPYLIDARRGAVEFREIAPAVINQSVAPGRGLQLTLDLGAHFKHSRIRISTGETNFKHKVRVETSEDGHSWAVARDDGYIFDFSQGDRHMALLTVDYPPSTMRYARVTVFGWMKTGTVSQAWAAYRNELPAERDVMDTVVPQRTEDPETKSSLLLIDLKQAGVPYDRVRLESDSRYYRAAELETSKDGKDWRFAASGTIFQTANEPSPGLTFGERHERYLRLRIFNGDDKPIPVKDVVIEATARLLKFALTSNAGPFYLFTGNPDAKAPFYDFAAILAREAPQPEVRAVLLAPADNPGYRPPPPPVKPWSERYPQLLYATLAIAILFMGYITVRFLFKVKNASG
jgi:Protein of unknown function (DUF3999)